MVSDRIPCARVMQVMTRSSAGRRTARAPRGEETDEKDDEGQEETESGGSCREDHGTGASSLTRVRESSEARRDGQPGGAETQRGRQMQPEPSAQPSVTSSSDSEKPQSGNGADGAPPPRKRKLKM